MINGAAAVDAISTSSFDVVAVDMQIPSSAAGLDAATVIRSNPVAASLPLVAITAYSGETDPVRFQTVGIDHRLAKPWRPEGSSSPSRMPPPAHPCGSDRLFPC